MQQPKPPIATKPKIKPKTNYVYARKVVSESKNDSTIEENSSHRNDIGNDLSSLLVETNKSKFNSDDELIEKNAHSSHDNSMRNSKVQEMKSKLFTRHKTQTFKQNQDELSSVTNRHQQKKSAKELEKILAMRNDHLRLKNENIMKVKSFDNAECSSFCEVSVEKFTNQMQQKLTAEIKQIQLKIGNIERVSVQHRYEERKVNMFFAGMLLLNRNFLLILNQRKR